MENQSQIQEFDKQAGIEGAQYDPPQDLCFDYPEIEEFLAAQGYGTTAGPDVDEPDAMDVSEDVAVDLSMKEAGATTEISTTTIVILDGGKLEVQGTTVTGPPEENPLLHAEVPEPLPGPSRMIDPDSLPVEYYQLPLIDAIAVFRHFGLSDPMEEAWKKGILKQAPLGDYFTFGEKLLFLMTTEILKDVGKTERFISVGWEALVEDAVKGLITGKAVVEPEKARKCKVLKLGLTNLRANPTLKNAKLDAVLKRRGDLLKKVVLDPYIIFPMTKVDVDVAYRAQLRAYLEHFTPQLQFSPDVALTFWAYSVAKNGLQHAAYDQGGLLLWLKLQLQGVTDSIGLRLNNMPVSFVPYDRAVRSNDKKVLAQLREDNKNCVRELQKLAAVEGHDKLFNKRVRGRKSNALFTPKDFLEEAELQMQKLKVQVEQKNKQAKQDEATIEKMKNELQLLKGIYPHAQKLQEVATGILEMQPDKEKAAQGEAIGEDGISSEKK